MIVRSKESVFRRGIIASTGRAWKAQSMSLSHREEDSIPVIADGQTRAPWEPVGSGKFTELTVVFQEKQESTAGGDI